MRYRPLVFVSLLSLAGAVLAQDASPPAGGSPRQLVLQPAPASSAPYHAGRTVSRAPADGVFKFRHDRSETETETAAAPPGIPGQPAWMRPAPVMGAGRMDANGRPPVDCARTPMDRQCR